MTEADRRPGEGHRGDIDDQSRAGEVSSSEGSRITRLPVRSLVAALNNLDDLGLCCCWVAPHGRRCKARCSR
ncbi:MAG: hypothetical protein WCF33_10165 [Pseudonocardiaceae bacterium]